MSSSISRNGKDIELQTNSSVSLSRDLNHDDLFDKIGLQHHVELPSKIYADHNNIVNRPKQQIKGSKNNKKPKLQHKREEESKQMGKRQFS